VLMPESADVFNEFSLPIATPIPLGDHYFSYLCGRIYRV